MKSYGQSEHHLTKQTAELQEDGAAHLSTQKDGLIHVTKVFEQVAKPCSLVYNKKETLPSQAN